MGSNDAMGWHQLKSLRHSSLGQIQVAKGFAIALCPTLMAQQNPMLLLKDMLKSIYERTCHPAATSGSVQWYTTLAGRLKHRMPCEG